MKKIIPILLLVALTLTACTGGPNAATKTPEELTQAYAGAIDGARDQELKDAIPVMTSADDDLAEFIFTMLGVTAEDMSAFAIAVSPMNVKAYGVAAIMPASGKEETVKKGLETFVDNQQKSFEQYLPDQYEVAKAAKVESQEDGTLLLVMCENQDEVYESIKKSLEG